MKAIAQFERTLISSNSKYDQYLRGDYQPTMLELQGLALFEKAPQPGKSIRGANCARCHGGPKTYMELFHNNGLDSSPKDAGIAGLTGLPGDMGRFKVPTLRNIALTGPYFHDGSRRTLKEVMDFYIGGGNSNPHLDKEVHALDFLTAQERADLLAFMEALTGDIPPNSGPPTQSVAQQPASIPEGK
jgi:cytochrome c peroxidase